jgi:hypothetical protein
MHYEELCLGYKNPELNTKNYKAKNNQYEGSQAPNTVP